MFRKPRREGNVSKYIRDHCLRFLRLMIKSAQKVSKKILGVDFSPYFVGYKNLCPLSGSKWWSVVLDGS